MGVDAYKKLHVITTIIWLHFINFKTNFFIFGKINNFYFVNKFQNRGSEHDHGIMDKRCFDLWSR
jgi:hypothetical protein